MRPVTIDSLNNGYVIHYMMQTFIYMFISLLSFSCYMGNTTKNWINNNIDKFTRLRIMYVLGVFQLVLTPFMLVYNMTLAKYIHIVKYIILIPLRFLTFKKKKWHYFMLEFCYYAALLLNLFIIQEQFLDGRFNHYFISIYAFASGPLLFAIYLNNDKLFFHSQSHLTSTYIHMTPALMVWGLRWHNNGTNFTELYPVDFSFKGIMSSYYDMFMITLPLYLVWAVSYYIYMFVYRWDSIYKKNNQTMYRQFAENEKLIVSKFDKQFKSSYTKGLFYIGSHALSSLLTTFIATIMFNNYYINTFAIVCSFLAVNWFASFKVIKSLQFYEEHRNKEKEAVIQQDKIFSGDEYSGDSEEEYMDAYGDNILISSGMSI
jgi:hypothetical protein